MASVKPGMPGRAVVALVRKRSSRAGLRGRGDAPLHASRPHWEVIFRGWPGLTSRGLVLAYGPAQTWDGPRRKVLLEGTMS